MKQSENLISLAQVVGDRKTRKAVQFFEESKIPGAGEKPIAEITLPFQLRSPDRA